MKKIGKFLAFTVAFLFTAVSMTNVIYAMDYYSSFGFGRNDGQYLIYNNQINVDYGYNRATRTMDYNTRATGLRKNSADDINEAHVAAIISGMPYKTSSLGKGVASMDEAVAMYCANFLNSFDWVNSSETVRMNYALAAISAAEYDFKDYGPNVAVLIDENVEVGNAPYNRTAYGCLIGKRCVCEGYCEAFHLLCRLMGLKAVIVNSPNNSHSVCWVKADGQWYMQSNASIGTGDAACSYGINPVIWISSSNANTLPAASVNAFLLDNMN